MKPIKPMEVVGKVSQLRREGLRGTDDIFTPTIERVDVVTLEDAQRYAKEILAVMEAENVEDQRRRKELEEQEKASAAEVGRQRDEIVKLRTMIGDLTLEASRMSRALIEERWCRQNEARFRGESAKPSGSLDARFAEKFAGNPNDLLRLKIDGFENSLIRANKRINELENAIELDRKNIYVLDERVAKLEKE